MFVENYKEVFLSYSKKTNYTFLHPTDHEILDEFLPSEEFMEEIQKIPLENVHWKKLYKYTLILEWIAFSFSIFIFLCLGVAIYVKFVSADFMFLLISYELWMTCWLLLALFLSFTMSIKSSYMNPLHEKITNDFTKAVEDKFTGVNFNLIYGHHCSIVVRPVSFDVKQIEIDNMDYFDFINYNSPDDDDFYKQNKNPMDCDPYQRNFKGEYLKQQEKLAAKEKKMRVQTHATIKIAK
jgi:hypothetical protein